MEYSVTLERGTDGGFMAWVHELPGCFARGATKHEVTQKIRPAIEEFLRWGQAPADRVRRRRPVQFAVVATEKSNGKAAQANSDVLLAPDRAPLTSTDWTRIERWLRRSRRELLRALGRVDHETFEWKPQGAPRSIRGHVEHLAFVEFMYMAWTFDLRSAQGIAEFLHWTHRLSVARMRQLAARDRGVLTHAYWSGDPRPEPWTARKAARRLLWHERLHLKAIERLQTRRRG